MADVELPAGSGIAGVTSSANDQQRHRTSSKLPGHHQPALGSLSSASPVVTKPWSGPKFRSTRPTWAPLSATTVSAPVPTCCWPAWRHSRTRTVASGSGSAGPTVRPTPRSASIVRFHSQLYACPTHRARGSANQKIVEVGGVAQPNNTIEANANKNQQVEFQLNTKTYAAGRDLPGPTVPDAMVGGPNSRWTGWDGSRTRPRTPPGLDQRTRRFGTGVPLPGSEFRPWASWLNDRRARRERRRTIPVCAQGRHHSGAVRPQPAGTLGRGRRSAGSSDPVTTWGQKVARPRSSNGTLTATYQPTVSAGTASRSARWASNGGLPSQD